MATKDKYEGCPDKIKQALLEHKFVYGKFKNRYSNDWMYYNYLTDYNSLHENKYKMGGRSFYIFEPLNKIKE